MISMKTSCAILLAAEAGRPVETAIVALSDSALETLEVNTAARVRGYEDLKDLGFYVRVSGPGGCRIGVESLKNILRIARAELNRRVMG